MYFNEPIKVISKTVRNDILNKWSNIYSYRKDYKYNKNSYDHLNETWIWTNKLNKETHALYMVMGNKIEDTFEIKYILEKPYSLDCDFLSLKLDLEKKKIIYNL
jgi:Icc-related predicted phosphoesterase